MYVAGVIRLNFVRWQMCTRSYEGSGVFKVETHPFTTVCHFVMIKNDSAALSKIQMSNSYVV